MSSPTQTITSPIDGHEVGRVPVMAENQLTAAIEAAAVAQPAWAARPLADRQALLKAGAQAMRDHAEELTDLLIREIGKTTKEAADEVSRSADLIDATADEASQLREYQIKASDFPGNDSDRVQTVRRQPRGVVAAIAPFNYPINLAVSKIAPALVMGNAVAFKPPTQGSVSGSRLAELLISAGLPADLLPTLTGTASEIGDVLTAHPSVAMIALTGSTDVGERLAKQAGLIPLLFELGGNDPAIVLADADLARTAQIVAAGAFKYAGQRCTAIKRVYVVASVADAFVAQLAAATREAFGSAGDPRQHPVGPVISDQQADYLQELFDDATQVGGRVISGGQRNGRYWEATIIDGLAHRTRLVTEEQFGPILPIVRVADAAEAIAHANDSAYGLQACLFTADVTAADDLATRLAGGGIHINDPDQRGPDNFLFVGHKKSGLGSQGIRFSLEAMSLEQGIVRGK